ncbi:MAG: hypothetical protein ACRDY6_08990 [Acidimicrobiia bacterium]
MASVAERVGVLELEALAACVAAVADHNQINVTPGGILDEERDGHGPGTPYVTVSVPTVTAAEVAAERLAHIAGIDAKAWKNGWRLVAEDVALMVDVYPEVDDPDMRAFVDAKAAELARRRRDLEDYVRELLVRAPDIEIADSGDDDDGRGYVAIAVTSVDRADRAERALANVADVDIELPWRAVERRLVTRVYPSRG